MTMLDDDASPPAAAPGAELTLQLSGTARCHGAGGEWLDLGAADALLLAWLAVEGPTPRERLAELLWPSSTPAAARNALRQRLHRLRRACGRDVVDGVATLQLAAGERHDLDAAPALLGELEAPEHALGTWLSATRRRRAEEAQRAAATQLDALEAAGDLDAALALAAATLRRSPLSEDAHRRVIRLHYLRGDRAAALLAFDRLEATLKHEVGTKPSAATLELLATIEVDAVAAPVAPPRGTVPATVLRPPRLVGRDHELLALQQGWRAAQTMLVVGEAGVGKSRLLHALAAGHDGAIAASARPGDALAPYASLARLLLKLLERRPEALDDALRTALAPLLPGIAPPQPAAPRRATLLPPLLALLERARRHVDGYVLDDVHFADDASVELLRELLAGPRGDDAVPWCLGLRPGASGSALADFVAALATARPLVQIVLQPLQPAQIEQLVDSLGLPGVRGSDIGAALWQRSGGNPLYALETLKAAWADGSLHGGGAALPKPPALAQLVAAQLARLSSGALALARLAAVAGSDFTLALAEQVLGSSALALADPWHELEAQHVLVGTDFAHDLIHEAVLDSVPAPIARHLHGEVAAWLEAHGGEPARVAAHWEAAGAHQRALPSLRAAAERAHRALRERERIAFLLRAADIAESAGALDEAYDCVAKAVASQVNSIREAGGFALLDRLDALARTTAQRAEALGLRAWYGSLLDEHDEDALRIGEQALALAATLPDSSLAGGIRQRLATALAMRGRFDEALPHFEAMHDWAVRHLAPEDRAEFHGNYAVALDNLGWPARAAAQHREADAACRRVGDPAAHATQLANEAVGRLNAGDVAAAVALLGEAQHLVQTYELQGGSAGFIAVLQLQCARARARYREALELADRAAALLEKALPARVAIVHIHRGHCWLDLGQYARAGQALQAAPLPPPTEVRRGVLLARLHAALGSDPAPALDAAEAARPRNGWPEVSLLVQAERARGLDVAAARAALEPGIALARERGLHGALLALLVRLADRGDAAAGREAIALVNDGVHPALATRGDVLLACARAALAAGARDDAEALLAAGRDWVEQTALLHVAEPFRESFVQRVATNALLVGEAFPRGA